MTRTPKPDETVVLAVQPLSGRPGGIWLVDYSGLPLAYVGIDAPGERIFEVGQAYLEARRAVQSHRDRVERLTQEVLAQGIRHGWTTAVLLRKFRDAVEPSVVEVGQALERRKRYEQWWRKAVADSGVPYLGEDGHEVSVGES